MSRIIYPISEPSTGLFENNPDKTSIEKFRFFHADEGKPLATPWQVALSRAIMLRDFPLSDGIILDCACGSGIQIAAYSEILKRPIVGIELNEARARASAVNFRTIFTERGNDSIKRLEDSVIIVGDGRKGSEIITMLTSSGLDSDKVAFLHLDPARPRNSRAHALSEMAPRLDEVFDGWRPYLVERESGPAILLDLSPRISKEQMIEVENLVESNWPGIGKTWTWTSRGRGRVDRLALWLGSVADPNAPRRFVRIPPDPTAPPFIILGGSPIDAESVEVKNRSIMAQRGLYMTIVDSALVESGLADSWLESLSFGTSYEWIKSSGRRPMICHVEPIANSQFELNNLIVTSGRVVEIIHRELTLETVDDFVDICLTHEVGKLTIRASLAPEIQPILQGSLDRQLARRHGTRNAFLLSNPGGDNFLLCVTN